MAEEAKQTKRKRGRPRKKRPVEMTLDVAYAHNEYLERKKRRDEPAKPQRSGKKIVFPRSHEGDILAYAWIGFISNPSKWLADYAEQTNYTPQRNPWTMSPAEQQRAIARVLCPRSRWGELGCGVNFEQDPRTLYTSCVVVLYSANLLNWWTVKYQYFRGAHFVAAQGSVDDLHRTLATGKTGKNVILPVLYYGLPIGDNSEFLVDTE